MHCPTSGGPCRTANIEKSLFLQGDMSSAGVTVFLFSARVCIADVEFAGGTEFVFEGSTSDVTGFVILPTGLAGTLNTPSGGFCLVETNMVELVIVWPLAIE